MVEGNHNVSSSNRISRRPDQQLCNVVITRVTATDHSQISWGVDTAYHYIRAYSRELIYAATAAFISFPT